MNWRTIIGLAAATSLGLAPFGAATAQTVSAPQTPQIVAQPSGEPPQSRPQRPFVPQTPPPPLPVVAAAKPASPPSANAPSAKASQKLDTNKKI